MILTSDSINEYRQKTKHMAMTFCFIDIPLLPYSNILKEGIVKLTLSLA